MNKWEYFAVDMMLGGQKQMQIDISVLNHLGDVGWELCASNENILIFKRKKA